MLFWERERRMRSFVAGQVMAFESGWGESQPDLRLVVSLDLLRNGKESGLERRQKSACRWIIDGWLEISCEEKEYNETRKYGKAK
jgi:hypothetical protein